MDHLTSAITEKLFSGLGQTCTLCGEACFGQLCLCKACLKDLPYLLNSCNTCALPLPDTDHSCGSCISELPPSSQCISLLNYEAPVDYLIQNMKYHHQLEIADLLGNLLAEKIVNESDQLPEQIIPMPLHISRLQHRGYNQAVEIAKPLSRKLQIPLNLVDCSRVLSTLPQSGLSAKERNNNLKNAFEVLRQIPAKHVAVVDDVMTTGTTVWEVARTLLHAGVERVDVWVCARAVAN